MLIPGWFAAAFGLSLSFRGGGPLAQRSDVLLLLLAVALLADSLVRDVIRRDLRKFARIALLCAGIVAVIFLADILNFAPWSLRGSDATWNYVRLTMGCSSLIVCSVLAVRGRGAFYAFTAGVAVAPLATLPVFVNLDEGVFIHGGRLAGYLQTPIIFGAWTLVAFVLAFGIFLFIRRAWRRAVLFVWLAILANFLLWSASRASWIGAALAILAFVASELGCRRLRRAFFVTASAAAVFALGYYFLPNALGMQRFVSLRAANLAESIATLEPQHIAAQQHSVTMARAGEFIFHHRHEIGFSGMVAEVKGSSPERAPATNNLFLEVGIYGGVPAILLFTALIGMACSGAWRFVRSLHDPMRFDTALRFVWLVAGAAFFVDIFFTQAFLWRHTWVVLGVLLGVAYLEPRGHEPPVAG